MIAPAVLGVGAVLLALCALLLYYGADRLGQAIIKFTPSWNIPLLGNLRNGVATIVEAGVGLVQAVLKPAVAPAISFFVTIGVWSLRVFGAIVNLAPTVAGALHRLWSIAIPAVLGRLRHWAAVAIADAIGLVTKAVDVLRTNVWAGITAARVYARTLLDVAAHYADNAVKAVRSYVASAVNVAEHEAAQLVHAAEAAATAGLHVLRVDLAQGLAAAEHELQLATSGLEHAIAQSVTVAEGYASTAAKAAAGAVESGIVSAATSVAATVDGLIRDDITALEQIIATDFPDIRALLGSIDVPAVGSLAGVLGISAVLDRVMVRYLRECGIPNCRNLGGFGHFLRDLLGVAEAGTLAALLAEIVHNPEGAARDAARELAAPLAEGRDLVLGMLGA